MQRQLCLEKSVKVKISISMNFVAKCCQPPGILGDFAVDCWKFIDFTRPGILRPFPCTDKNGIAHCETAVMHHDLYSGTIEIFHTVFSTVGNLFYALINSMKMIGRHALYMCCGLVRCHWTSQMV